ncbi:Ig-like domain repeat protein [Rhodococcus hoagii]|nr:Ig-like domain repeat protein [Prescottella equi]
MLAGVTAVGLLVAGGGPAFAADPPPLSNQGSSDNVKYKKEVIGSNVVHRGDTVTYKSRIWADSGAERYIRYLRDVPPAGFTLVAGSPKVTYLGATNKATFSNESDGGVTAKCSGSGCNVFGNGFIVKSGQDVTFEVSYQVPTNAAFADYDSGVLLDVYAFSGNPKGSNPFNVKVRVEEIATTTTLQVPATATTGQPATLTAAVNPTNASGQIQFKDGSSVIGSPVTLVNGVATLPHAFGTAGTRNITAEFVPAAGYLGSTSAAQTLSVADAATSLFLQVPASAESGAPVILTANVAPSNAAGAVQFKDNGTDIGTPVSVADGAASMQHTFTADGPHSITAVFTGNAGFAGSTASLQTVNVSVPDVPTSTTLTVPPTAQTNASVMLSATVTPVPTSGTVQFKAGGTNIGTPVTLVNGVATLEYSFTSAGSPSITAEFNGSTGFASSVSAAQPVTVTDPDVETTLSVTAPGTAETGQSVTLTAAVSPPTAQGDVQFKVDGNPVGAPQAVSGGSASLPYTFDAAGSFEVTADFTGASGFANASAAAQTVTVSVPDVVTSLTLDVPATAVTSTPVDLAATVSPSGAQGTVQFTDNGNPIGAPVSVVNDVATLPYTFADAGSHSIGASFTGGLGFTDAAASSTASIVVSDPDQLTTTTVTVPAAAQAGTAVTLEATVAPIPSGGTVQFQIGGVGVGVPVTVSGGTASLPWTFDAAGSFAVAAVYSGAPGFEGSTSAPQSVAVSDPDVTTSLTVQVPATAVTGMSVDLTATVSPAEAQGTVQFTDNGTPIGAPVAVVNGVATLPHTFATTGPRSISASFTGALGFTDASATSPGSIVVSDPVEQTSLSVTVPTAATTGESVNLSATVSPSNAQGRVQFEIDGVPVGSPQTVSGGAASLPYTFNAADTHAVTAEFTGAAGFTNSTASAQTVTVSDPAPVDVATSTLVGVPGSATTGAPTTLSVTVQAQSGSAVPTGSVQFRENGSPIGSPVVLVNGSASVDHIFTVVGTRQVSAVYTADAGFVGSASVDRPVVVSAPNPSDAVSSVVIVSTQSPTAGAPYVLKAQVIGAPSLPGTVQFFDGGVEIGAPVPVVDGVAELTHTFTQSGPSQIHAVYSGGTGVAGSTSVTQTLDVVQSGGGTGGTGSLDLGSLGSLSGLGFVF